jgi:anti-sigma B factor antagonist
MGARRSRRAEPIPLGLTTEADCDGAMRLNVVGEIDMATVDPLTDTMISIIRGQKPKRLVVNFADVAFLDSLGVSALVAAWHLASTSDVDFAVTNCRPNVLRVLEITGLVKALNALPPEQTSRS